MRTTVDLRPTALAELKAMAARQKSTLGRVIEQLLEKCREDPSLEEIDGLPVLRPRIPGLIITSEEVYRLMDQP